MIAVVTRVMGTWEFVFRDAVAPMLWTCTTAEQDDGRRLSSVRGARVFQRHLLERWPYLQGVGVSC